MKSLVVFLTVLVGVVGMIQDVFPAEVPSEEGLRGRAMVLTSPDLAGRASGTPESEAAAETLAAWMEDLALQPGFGDTYFQTVPLTGTGWAGEDLAGKFGRNVAGILPGSGPLAGRYVVVGAHFDHLGRVKPAPAGAAPPVPGEYYPGANDNASGVAILFEMIRLAEARSTSAEGRRAVLFVGFTGEEVGLQGSGFMVSHPPVSPDSLDAMINLDTVGQLTDNRLHVSGVGTADIFPDLVAAANTGELELSLAQGGWSGSDHMAFNTREIPVLFLFGGAYPQYNRPADDWPTLDYPAMARVAAYADRLLDLVRTGPREIPWIMVAEKSLREDDDPSQNRQTWLGTLPDFTEEIEGYKLAGVFDGSPAARAGLQKGDVLVRFGGDPVIDLATFTRALRAHGPGDPVEILVERDGMILNFTVVLGNRADRN